MQCATDGRVVCNTFLKTHPAPMEFNIADSLVLNRELSAIYLLRLNHVDCRGDQKLQLLSFISIPPPIPWFFCKSSRPFSILSKCESLKSPNSAKCFRFFAKSLAENTKTIKFAICVKTSKRKVRGNVP